MSETRVTFKQKITRGVHYLRDRLGLPVNYTEFEFSSFKKTLDWSRLPHDRESTLGMIFGTPPAQIRGYILEAEATVIDGENGLRPDACTGLGNPMGRTDRITLYAAVRAFRPHVVFETGTAAGASAASILEALEKNGQGCLYTVDRDHREGLSGHRIPDYLKARVRIRTGNSLSVLPELIEEAGKIDFFSP